MAVINLNRRGLLLSGAGLALAGCARGGVSAEEAARRFPSVQAAMDRHVAAGHVPGIVTGLRTPGGEDVFLQSGHLDFDQTRGVDADSLWRIYSMTKPITGVAAVLLIEDGVLTLDSPVTEFIPEFAGLTVAVDPASGLDARPATQVMTVRHLLTHTSGFTYHFFEGPVADAYRRSGVIPITGYNLAPKDIDAPQVRDLDAMARALADIPLMFEPGTAYLYSISLDVLGLVIQRASGMAFPDFVQRRLLDPIGMDDTVWRLRGEADKARLGTLYNFQNGERTLIDRASESAYADPVSFYIGGAGLLSSARDYLAFLSTLLNDGLAGRVRVMAPETARLVRTDILPPDVQPEDGFRYGFGGYVMGPDKDNAGVYGWGGAAGTQGWIDPTRNYAATIMVQHFWQDAPIEDDIRAGIDADLAR